nr:polyketide synthase [Colletotrichum truncatum]KAF6781878.1 polyketide synthase [Colletotrichum truncatum]
MDTPPPSPPLRKELATLLLFSAGHEESLKIAVKGYKDLLNSQPSILQRVAHTLTHHRKHLKYRSFVVVTDEYEKLVFNQPPLASFRSNTRNEGIAFIFTGQGAQWARMGSHLLKTSREFLQDIREMDIVLKGLPREHRPSWDIKGKFIYSFGSVHGMKSWAKGDNSGELMRSETLSRLGEAEFAQPVCTALQIALVKHLARYNVKPKAVVGHSSGEIAAAYAAGVLTMKEAIIVAYYRGLSVKKLKSKGAMAAIGLGRGEVTVFLVTGVTIACENSSTSVTLSGDAEALDRVCLSIRKAKPNAFVRLLKVDKAYHSRHMSAVGAEYQALLKPHLKPCSPTISFFSSVSSTKLEQASDFGPGYWQHNLESTVLFRQAVTKLLQTCPTELHLEVGPHSALAGPLKQIYSETAVSPAYASVQKRGENSMFSFLAAVGELHCRGFSVRFPKIDDIRPLTDLPPYPWHRSLTYWPDSRIIKGWQFPEHPPHELLGSRVLEGASAIPSWRCVLSLDKVPWLKDHCVGPDVVYPAAAYVTMVGEAIQQLCKTKAFTIRDLSITNALVLTQGQHVEILTSARRERLTRADDSEWWELSIQSWNSTKTWTTHCTCRAKGGRTSKKPELSTVKGHTFLRTAPSRHWYKAMSRVGYNYGPHFRGMQTIQASVTHPAALIDVSFEGASQKENDIKSYGLDSRIIDQVFQSLVVAAHSGQPRLLQKLHLPTQIQEIFIDGLDASEPLQIKTLATGASGVCQGEALGVWADGINESPVVFMKGMCFSSVNLENSDTSPIRETKASHVSLKPDIDLADSGILVSSRATEEFSVVHQLLEELFVHCGSAMVHELTTFEHGPEIQPHLKKHLDWLKAHISLAKYRRDLTQEERKSEIEMISTRLKHTPASSAAILIKRCYSHARALFASETTPLEVFLQGNALHELYDWMNTLFSYSTLLQLLSHKRGRHLRILEIGAGTGGLTARILSSLMAFFEDGKVVGKYDFTDVSAGFFPAAKKRFEKIPSNFLDYRVLDISRDPIDQGFVEQEYDLIVASNVLHATPDLDATLRHARSLLKPDGRLLLHELCSDTKWINFIMGYLPGWWLGAGDSRPDEPYISPEKWADRLSAARFSPQNIFYDDDTEYRLNATIIARPACADSATRPLKRRITLLYEHDKFHPVVETLRQTLEEKGHSVVCSNMESVDIETNCTAVSVIDLCRNGGYFNDMTQEKLEAFQHLLQILQSRNSALLWLTRSCQLNPTNPTYAPVLGVARTVRVEMGLPFATLEVDDVHQDAIESVSKTLESIHDQRKVSSSSSVKDMEFVYSCGSILIPRYQWTSISQSLQASSPPAPSKALRIERLGALQTLHWASCKLPQQLSPDHVEIKVHAAGLNFKDVITAMGLIRPSSPHGLGCEASGVVTAVGASVSNLRVGDRVMAFAPEAGCLSTDLQIPAQLCARIPDSLSFAGAAGMPCIFITVLRALVDKACLQSGQSVLIHSAAGGVGIAALQVARWVGATVYATVGSDEKAEFLSREWNIPRERIFSSRNPGFVDGIKSATCNRGVDVVLNSLSGELLHMSWDCVAPHGAFIELGKRDTLAGGKLSMAAFDENRSFVGVEMANLASQNPNIICHLLERTVELYKQGVITPVQPIHSFSCQEVEGAFRHLYTGKHIGKVVVNLSEESQTTLGSTCTIPTPEFRPDAAYMLVGGMGGLGSSMARWMASHGARDLLFVSRSAGKSESDQRLLAELREMGCEATAVPCDITDESTANEMISTILSSKVISGVVNLAMVLSDAELPALTITQWETATAPKIRGTWNLHRLLPRNMDFFVLLGSTSGIHGYPGQANYAAANAFLDSFAQYRHGLGLPCSVVDLGGVEDVGYVSRTQGVEDTMRKAGVKLVSETDMLRAVQLAITRSQPRNNELQSGKEIAFNSQFVVGLDCTIPIDDSATRVVWRQDPRMVFYPNDSNSHAMEEKEREPGLSNLISRLQQNPQELDAPATVLRLSAEIAKRVFGFLMREVDGSAIDIGLSPSELGVDSLMTIEIRNWWKHTMGVDLRTAGSFGCVTA